MPYLSRIRINHLRPASRELLANPHVAHGAVIGGLPDLTATERLLWRWDTDRTQRQHLLVLSESKPDWTHITEQYGWPGADGEHATIRDYTPLLDRIAVGQDYAFRVTANPVQNLPPATPADGNDTGKRRSRRTGHRTARHQWNWFLSRTGKWGFDVPAARISESTDLEGTSVQPDFDMRITHRQRLAFTKTNRSVVLTIATFEGRLRITDRDTFTHHLLNGFGPAKAYGCGLLTLAPLPESGGD